MSLPFPAGVVAWAFLLGACGFPQPRDVGPMDAAIDTPTTPRCNPRASFGTPVPLTSLNTDAEDEQANLSDDELTIYFSSTRPGGAGTSDIYQATRMSRSMPFGSIMPVAGVNTADEEREPRVTANGLVIFAIGTPPPAPGYHITLATRPNTLVAFGPLQSVANVNSVGNDVDPYILPTGDVLYFSSDRSGNFELYRSARVSTAFSTPAPVSGIDLSLPSVEGNPVVTLDELTLFFSSNRSGGAGNYDIYEATRSNLADGFGAPVALTDLNTADLDTPTWISPDGCQLYFTRVEANLGRQLYVTARGQ